MKKFRLPAFMKKWRVSALPGAAQLRKLRMPGILKRACASIRAVYGWLQHMLAKLGIGPKLYLALSVTVVMTLAASAVGYVSMVSVSVLQRQMIGYDFPWMSNSSQLVQHSLSMVSKIPRLIAVNSVEEQEIVASGLERHAQQISSKLEILNGMTRTAERAGAPYLPMRFASFSDALFENVGLLYNSVKERLELQAVLQKTANNIYDIRLSIDRYLGPIIDDQIFFLFTGMVNIEDAPVERDVRLSERNLIRYRSFFFISVESSKAVTILEDALSADIQFLGILQESFSAAISRLNRAMVQLEDEEIQKQLQPHIQALSDAGNLSNGVFQVRQRMERPIAVSYNVLQHTYDIAQRVENVSLEITEEASQAVETKVRMARQAVTRARFLLLSLGGISILIAFAISWLYIGRRLIGRMTYLANRMHEMATGNLEVTVAVSGQDEVATMAADLEVFRKKARDAQRLDRAEALSRELRDKNEELETTMQELEKTHEQMVMQEKLASLGQLTAGIAHEIKNPLNFVNNFAGTSKSLLDELKEALEDLKEKVEEKDRDYIEEIISDLDTNCSRIQEHGKRADRIIHGMLQHSRGGEGEFQEFDINQLLDEYAQLAFHSMRANNSAFNLDLKKDYDDAVGQIEIIPQDMSRVFLNIIMNACQAMEDKITEQGPDYMPTITLHTKRKEDTIFITIRDNGPGMKEEVAKKIFNPFFTTKDSGKGTGLGLSISYDIVRRHDGKMEMSTKPGSHTEFVITIPDRKLVKRKQGYQEQEAVAGKTKEEDAVAAKEEGRVYGRQ